MAQDLPGGEARIEGTERVLRNEAHPGVGVHLAPIRFLRAEQEPGEGRLPTARFAHHAEYFTAGNGEIDAIDRREAGPRPEAGLAGEAIFAPQPFGREDGGCSLGPSGRWRR